MKIPTLKEVNRELNVVRRKLIIAKIANWLFPFNKNIQLLVKTIELEKKQVELKLKVIQVVNKKL